MGCRLFDKGSGRFFDGDFLVGYGLWWFLVGCVCCDDGDVSGSVWGSGYCGGVLVKIYCLWLVLVGVFVVEVLGVYLVVCVVGGVLIDC